ncbi:MAG TPA: nucleoside hydrolase [Bacteroidota bacterium]|nr:nucleoside hydrolase [Bacteroidota bacterium]
MKSLLLIIALLVPMVLFSEQKQKIILDCDFGGDLDDAFAVALVLSSPEFDVLGFVMDHGNTPLRARTILKMLYETGKESIPVYVGHPTPNIVGVDKDIAGPSYQFSWSEGFEKVNPAKGDAAEFIVRTLNKYPGEVILFTVGPVCNIKEVIARDTDALKRAKRIVSMFGSYYVGYGGTPAIDAEWNVRADIAAAKVFTQCGANIVYAGLDVTTMVKLNEANRMRLLMRQSPLTNALCGLYSLWLYEPFAAPDPTLHDVVAISAVLWPDLFTSHKAFVNVDDKGYTLVDERKEPNCEILTKVNTEELLKRIMERLLKQNLGRENHLMK